MAIPRPFEPPSHAFALPTHQAHAPHLSSVLTACSLQGIDLKRMSTDRNQHLFSLMFNRCLVQVIDYSDKKASP